MKLIYFLYLCVAILLNPIRVKAGSPQNFRVFTMNLHCFEESWEFRFRHILNFILEKNPDLISFQEVCVGPGRNSSQISFITNYLSAHGYPVRSSEEQYTHPAWGRYDEYLLMISRHPAARIEKGLLPTSLLQRGFVGLQIEGRWYVNSHLEYKKENASSRREQIEFLQRRFSQLPQIMMGDFNSAPDSPEQQPFWNGRYTPVFPGQTFIGVDDNGKNKIDGFWLSPQYVEQIFEPRGAVVLKDKVNDQFLSDHFGVILELSFK